MKRQRIWLSSVVAFLGSILLVPLLSAAATAPAEKISPEVYQALATKPKVRVVIVLKEPVAPPTDLSGRMAEIKGTRDGVLSKHGADDLVPTDQWETLSALAGEVTLQGVETLAADPNVVRVDLDIELKGGLAESVPLIHGDVVHTTLGVTGLGATVAVLDTGVDSRHPDLATDVVAEACFCKNLNGTGCCPTGALTLTGPGSALDDNGHGTGIAGIITSDGLIAAPGVAPAAKLVAVKVLDTHNSAASLAQILSGLNWVILNQGPLNIKIANLSLGTGALYTGVCDTADAATAAFAQALNTLKGQGVSVFAASMNNGSSTQLAAPACLASAIAVGAVYDANIGSSAALTTQYRCTDLSTAADQVACFSNTNSALALLAPGAAITTTALSTTGTTFGTADFAGTSQATPHAAGAAALLLQVNPALTPDQIAAALKATGVQITDPRNGLTFPRIDLQAAVQSVLPDATGPTLVITSPLDNATVTSSLLTVSGTASDATTGGSGISAVTVNGVAATGGTATGDLTATWSASVTLTPGLNSITVVAKDNSPPLNPTSQTLNVTFAPPVLTVTKAGAGSGTVTSTPPGITCGTTCSATFAADATVTLTATPATGFAFANWSGDCAGPGPCTVTMTLGRSVTATFQDATAPTVVHLPVASATINSAIPIIATITDNIGVQGATLFYRTIGASTYTAVAMTASGSTFSGAIPASAVTRAGVQYYLEARDAANNIRPAPSTPPGASYSVVVGITVFTDDPLAGQSTPIKAIHFTELRDAINALRARYSLGALIWSGTAPAPGGTVSASHLTDLRAALTLAYLKAGRLAPGYTDSTIAAGVTVIQASHLSELRALVRGLE
jgi:subtilisin family serine protease